MLYQNAFRNYLHLDPAPDGAGGGAADAAASPGGSAAPAFDASQYVPRADFERVNQEFGEYRNASEQRFRDFESRLPQPQKREPKEDKEPNAEDGSYDFNKPGEFQRYQRDLANYYIRQGFQQREQETQKQQQDREYRESVQGALSSHAERQDAYKALNPDYDPYKSVNIGNEAVTLEILTSDYSAQIHHFFQKNPDKLSELRKLAQTNPGSAVRMVGRIEASFEAQEAAAPAKKAAAAAQPTTGGFGGGKPSGQPARTQADIVKEWRMT